MVRPHGGCLCGLHLRRQRLLLPRLQRYAASRTPGRQCFFAAHSAAIGFRARCFALRSTSWPEASWWRFVGMAGRRRALALVQRSQEIGWLLTLSGLVWTLWRVGRLRPVTVVRAGARAGLVGLMLALVSTVGTARWSFDHRVPSNMRSYLCGLWARLRSSRRCFAVARRESCRPTGTEWW